MECKYCELDIRRGDYHEHSEQCGSRTDFCELCNQRVMLKEMSEHKLTKCGHMRAESPLQRYQLEGMGLLGQQDGGESDSSDDFNPNYYPPHVIGRPTTPPPPYERRNDESMHVDPHWLQTVAEACGEDNLDALLAQNVFFENMRSVRSDGNFAASGPAVVSHDNHVTTEESSEDGRFTLSNYVCTLYMRFNEGFLITECSIVREKPPIAHDRPGDNRLLDEDFSRQLAATNEQDDFFLAQRMQEREVMGHSRTLYEEKTVREIATEAEREERERESEEEGENSWREMEEGSRREVEEEDEEVKSKAANKAANKAEQEELERLYEDELAAKKLEIEELAKKLKESTENQKRLQKDIEERREEIDSLRLATELQKADLAEGHKALWRKTARTPQLDDERLARRLQMKEDRLQYSHTHLEEEEEPRPKSPPSQSYADDTFSEKIPCQWCAKLIPFEQVMLHQVSDIIMNVSFILLSPCAPSNHAMMISLEEEWKVGMGPV